MEKNLKIISMQELSNNVLAAWLVLISVLLSLSGNFEDRYRETAGRLDLKIVKSQLSGRCTANDGSSGASFRAVVARMGKLRNESRARADGYQSLVLFLSISGAIGAIAISVNALSRAVLFMMSIVVSALAALTFFGQLF